LAFQRNFWQSVTPRQILSLGEHQVKSYEKLTKPWGFAGFCQTKGLCRPARKFLKRFFEGPWESETLPTVMAVTESRGGECAVLDALTIKMDTPLFF
jgi:hypothetical protein